MADVALTAPLSQFLSLCAAFVGGMSAVREDWAPVG